MAFNGGSWLMKGALDVHRELLSRDVPHEIVRLPRSIVQADELPAALGVDPDRCMTVRVFVAGERMVAVGLPAGREPQLGALLRAVGSPTLRAATTQEVNAATDFAAGLVPPLPLPTSMPFFVDAQVGRNEVTYTATGDTGTALGIATGELLLAVGARVADLTTPSLAELVVDLEV
jgi:prolyl-tRNA editing enzyme YbaK/EbsC (Cys-tRNA(Pro) deacylase)